MSSFSFQNQLSNVLYGEEYVRCAPNLLGDDAVWLVDNLGTVRHWATHPYSLRKPA